MRGETFENRSPHPAFGAKIGRPDLPCVGFAGDGAFGISMNEMTACGRREWPNITMVIFRNFQWGAEKRNATLWYEDNFVGTELDAEVSYAKIAEACGVKGVQARTTDELTELLATACKDQAHGVTTLIGMILSQELGEPFRRDAMTAPVAVAGINASDMRPQQPARSKQNIGRGCEYSHHSRRLREAPRVRTRGR
ncbi:MAG: hypothetical protein E4H01_00630, partial [Lysobacterales bacterium]